MRTKMTVKTMMRRMRSRISLTHPEILKWLVLEAYGSKKTLKLKFVMSALAFIQRQGRLSGKVFSFPFSKSTRILKKSCIWCVSKKSSMTFAYGNSMRPYKLLASRTICKSRFCPCTPTMELKLQKSNDCMKGIQMEWSLLLFSIAPAIRAQSSKAIAMGCLKPKWMLWCPMITPAWWMLMMRLNAKATLFTKFSSSLKPSTKSSSCKLRWTGKSARWFSKPFAARLVQ